MGRGSWWVWMAMLSWTFWVCDEMLERVVIMWFGELSEVEREERVVKCI